MATTEQLEQLMLNATNWIAIGTILSAVAAIFAIVVSCIIYFGQKKITEKINKDQLDMAQKLHDSQRLLEQRQLLVPLWSYMWNLNEIDSNTPITSHIVKAIQTMELVAVCCEGEMIDKKVIIRTFQRDFIKLYDSIKSCSSKIAGLDKTGNELLMDAKSASSFYEELKKLHLKTDAI